MNQKLYKYCLLSFILINFWTLYGFFDYYIEMQEPASWFRGLGLGVFYLFSLFAALGFGAILLLVRLTFYFIARKNILKSNFLYILSALFNLNLILISIISISLEILRLDIDFISYLLGLLVSTTIIIFDVYSSNFKIKEIKPNA